MKMKIFVMVSTILLLAFGQAGCSTSQTSAKPQPKPAAQTTPPAQPTTADLEKAFQDELNGLATIETNVSTQNYKDAETVATSLHNEFQTVILPFLKEKKGQQYADGILKKYTELQEAIKNQKSKDIEKLIKTNLDNLYTIAPLVGVSLK